MKENRFLPKEIPENSFGMQRPERLDTLSKKSLGVLAEIKMILAKNGNSKAFGDIISLLGKIKNKDGVKVRNWPSKQKITGEIGAHVKNWPKGPQEVKFGEIPRPEWWENVNLSEIESKLSVLYDLLGAIQSLDFQTDISVHENVDRALATKLHKDDLKKIISALNGIGGPGPFDAAMVEYLKQIKLNTASSNHWIDNEIPTGDIDDVNTDFELSVAPNPTMSLQVFLNGAFQTFGVDYSLSGTTITFFSAPLTGSILRAFYRY